MCTARAPVHIHIHSVFRYQWCLRSLQWFQSVCTTRRFQVNNRRAYVCGVSQGLALGPILFIMYTALSFVTFNHRYQVRSHCRLDLRDRMSSKSWPVATSVLYADDTQVYSFCRNAEVDDFYLADSLQRVTDVQSRRRLRSSSSTLVVPVTRATLGDRSFPVAATRA